MVISPQNDKVCHLELVSGSGSSGETGITAPHPTPSHTGREQHDKHKSRAAFTLAEVLITLGIIGVVAAMTISSLMTKIEEKVLINQLW